MTTANGYTLVSTFYSDFSIADRFGADAIQDTFNRAFKEWRGDYIYLTELVLVLNWKAWEHTDRREYSDLYISLYEKADAYACKNLKGKQAEHFFSVTD